MSKVTNSAINKEEVSLIDLIGPKRMTQLLVDAAKEGGWKEMHKLLGIRFPVDRFACYEEQNNEYRGVKIEEVDDVATSE